MATIQIPDSLYARLLSMGCASESFYISALEEALDRRKNVSEKRPVGRPLKGEGRKAGTWHMELPYQVRIEAEAERLGISRSDVLNTVLTKADEHGLLPVSTDETR